MFRLPWIDANTPLPPPEQAMRDPAGLLCAGAPVTADRLKEAYANGIFPWYNPDQPPLWWSTDPRMVLFLDEFKLHRSLEKVMRRQLSQGRWQASLDKAFTEVVLQCAQPREGQDGTWITPEIVQAYSALHAQGLAHSVEIWQDHHLIGGLYGVALGKMFFGESMFTRVQDASKTALVLLVRLLQREGFTIVDCQQETRHLASFGARPVPRVDFLAQLRRLVQQPAPNWTTLQV